LDCDSIVVDSIIHFNKLANDVNFCSRNIAQDRDIPLRELQLPRGKLFRFGKALRK